MHAEKILQNETLCNDFGRATAICTAIAGVPYLAPLDVRYTSFHCRSGVVLLTYIIQK